MALRRQILVGAALRSSDAPLSAVVDIFTARRGRPLTQDLAEYTFYLDITRDQRTATTIATKLISNIWMAPARDPSQARQVTSDDFPLTSVAEAFDGKLLTVGGG